jgi:hypothetical protein
MKPRHAAALALVGWYLMSPLVDHKAEKLLYEAPLTYWEHEGSFDTAAECERKLRDNMRVMSNLTMSNLTMKSTDRSPGYNLGLNSALAAKCIASDDPRLKGN